MGARPIGDGTAGLQDHLIDRCTTLMARFVESDPEAFPYRGKELGRLQKRLDDLTNGRDVLVYRFELGDYAPPREVSGHVFTLHNDTLIEAQSELVPVEYDPEW
jgi:hypothetical protein